MAFLSVFMPLNILYLPALVLILRLRLDAAPSLDAIKGRFTRLKLKGSVKGKIDPCPEQIVSRKLVKPDLDKLVKTGNKSLGYI